MGNVYTVLSERQIKPQADNYSQRLIIEQCENIHWHYRDMRLEFSVNEFFDVCRAFSDALSRLQEQLFRDKQVSKIPIGKIDPFDNGHQEKGGFFDCGEEQENHKEGIASIKQWLQSGHHILPIAVFYDENKKKYLRMDGFKRYWAFKELGLKEIECYVFVSEYVAGIQEGMNIYEP